MAKFCCCCIPLQMGVKIIAALWALSILQDAIILLLPCRMARVCGEANWCSVSPNPRMVCRLGDHRFVIFLYINSVITILVGVAGVCAASRSVAKKDEVLMKMFFVAYALLVVVRRITELVQRSTMQLYDTPTVVAVVVAWVVMVPYLLHYLDVIWSAANMFKKEVRGDTSDTDSADSSDSNGGNILVGTAVAVR
mmetsp:Transcript_126534/g.369741  ORF Transcript_126534/g.369741 Transcript_126534/m.369741 type:complete len:195 (+) Transcript_126534:92-676(+)